MKRTGENPVSPSQLRISLISPIQDGEIWPNLCNGGLLKSTYGTKITGNPSKIFSLGFPKSPGFIRTLSIPAYLLKAIAVLKCYPSKPSTSILWCIVCRKTVLAPFKTLSRDRNMLSFFIVTIYNSTCYKNISRFLSIVIVILKLFFARSRLIPQKSRQSYLLQITMIRLYRFLNK